MKLKKMLKRQKKFSDCFFDSKSLTEAEKIELHKTFCLSMHSELSFLANTVQYRDHRPTSVATHRENILFETMDVMRYSMAMLNLWDFSIDEIENAFKSRAAHLENRNVKNIENWNGNPVIVCDMDDVLTRFRQDFYAWINKTYGQNLDEKSGEYYLKSTVDGKSSDALLAEFTHGGKNANLGVNKHMVAELKQLHDAGYWIHILTARPSSNLKCLYETYEWLAEHVPFFDSVSLKSEKYLWLASTEPYKAGQVVCAIDDSPKHAAEFAQHGIPTLIPKRNYNRSVWKNENITYFDWERGSIQKYVAKCLNNIGA